jgi:hypothetical protein
MVCSFLSIDASRVYGIPVRVMGAGEVLYVVNVLRSGMQYTHRADVFIPSQIGASTLNTISMNSRRRSSPLLIP